HDNQVALVAAVRRISEQGNSLLLDGHFVLIGPHAEFIRLPPSVFKDLNLTGVILIEASPEIISSRLSSRDDSKSTVDIALFLEAERAHAKLICETLNLPLEILFQPTHEVFADVAKKIIGKI
ncbi:TPA: AAA family ATPase, partial [Pseudomonas aeruginosa]